MLMRWKMFKYQFPKAGQEDICESLNFFVRKSLESNKSTIYKTVPALLLGSKKEINGNLSYRIDTVQDGSKIFVLVQSITDLIT